MTRTNLLIATAIAVVTISVLALLNRPEIEPRWPDRVQGFSFSPLHADQDPARQEWPSLAQIDADLALLKGKARSVRTYSMEATMGEIAPLAAKHGLNVTLGAWIGPDLANNELQIERLIAVANSARNVDRVIVGNEVMYRGDIPIEQLIGYIERVRAAVRVPVSTAEPWGTWLKYPELEDHVDFVATHILPYWEGVHVDKAVDFVASSMNTLRLAFPGKPIVISEVGWPSEGRTRRAANASPANEAIFLRRFLQRAESEKYDYFVLEAFDQPWKRQAEGAVGAYWGVWDVERQPKFSFGDPVVANPQWRTLGAISVIIAGITFALMVVPSRTLRRRGRSFLAVVAYGAATVSVWVVYDYLNQYLTWSGVFIGVLLLVGLIGVVLVLLTEAHEWAEALWVTGRARGLKLVHLPDGELPFVSIHVPAYNEPPAMMIETLAALAKLDYPAFEVLVIDNNTKDPQVWQPVQAYCQSLGPRFRFFHVDPLSGFKAGALNFALRHTAPEAQIIAVIDSDYRVNRRWLRDLVPQFVAPKVAIVQAPQDYRDGSESAFKAMCYSEYAGFFYAGMCTRNERNAIIQHGTMTLVRRRVLEEVGGWAEWCITEDAELGLRIFERGYEAHYIPRSYGRGLMPDTFGDYKQQRFRWAYGAVQILREHRSQLFGRGRSELSPGQRYHFLAGWLPWFADAFNLIFTLLALAWSLGMVLAPRQVEPPLMVFSALPLALFVFKLAKLAYIYKSRIGASTVQTIAGAVAGLALAHTISRAMLRGLFTRSLPFHRTPKRVPRHAWGRALATVREEAAILVGLWCAALGVTVAQGTDSPDLLMWVIVLLIQSLPYVASVIMSVIGSLPRLSARRIGVKWMKRGRGPTAPLAAG